jgi:hypothetical protein
MHVAAPAQVSFWHFSDETISLNLGLLMGVKQTYASGLITAVLTLNQHNHEYSRPHANTLRRLLR